jgi:hypothetical protein
LIGGVGTFRRTRHAPRLLLAASFFQGPIRFRERDASATCALQLTLESTDREGVASRCRFLLITPQIKRGQAGGRPLVRGDGARRAGSREPVVAAVHVAPPPPGDGGTYSPDGAGGGDPSTASNRQR